MIRQHLRLIWYLTTILKECHNQLIFQVSKLHLCTLHILHRTFRLQEVIRSLLQCNSHLSITILPQNRRISTLHHTWEACLLWADLQSQPIISEPLLRCLLTTLGCKPYHHLIQISLYLIPILSCLPLLLECQVVWGLEQDQLSQSLLVYKRTIQQVLTL